jgi:hypothetical protein
MATNISKNKTEKEARLTAIEKFTQYWYATEQKWLRESETKLPSSEWDAPNSGSAGMQEEKS